MSLAQEDMVNIFTQGVTTWNQVNSAYPTETITLIMVADPDVSSIFLSTLQLTSVTFTTGYVSPPPLCPFLPRPMFRLSFPIEIVGSSSSSFSFSSPSPSFSFSFSLFLLLLSLSLFLLLLLPLSPSPLSLPLSYPIIRTQAQTLLSVNQTDFSIVIVGLTADVLASISVASFTTASGAVLKKRKEKKRKEKKTKEKKRKENKRKEKKRKEKKSKEKKKEKEKGKEKRKRVSSPLEW